MTEPRPMVHLVCTAHIDPVWMWAWEEGLRETISTFRTAVNLLHEYPEFVFNHNESMLYEWIEAYDPLLFQQIQALVAAGRWNISGGWYLQPDCNMPGGETLTRLILEGRRYFARHFGVRPNVAYNFDTFGHPQSLPQLLRQTGFDLYIHCRPTGEQMPLPDSIYRWRGMDGSEVLAIRPDTGWYCTPFPGQAQMQARSGIDRARRTGMDALVLWGLGDHGGGATRRDLDQFRALFDEFKDSDVILWHSTPEAFAARILPYYDQFPLHEGELQRTLSGTYTSVAPIKRQMRTAEALLAEAERLAAAAWWRGRMPYPVEQLHAAWKRLMFTTFHDILCGSLLETAIEGVNEMYGYARDLARRVVVGAQHALLPGIPPAEGAIPLYIFNPHTAAVRAPVGVNFLSAYAPPPEKKAFSLYDDAGQAVACQTSGGSSAVLDESTWQPFCGFVAEVPPFSVKRYEIRFEPPNSPATGALKIAEDDMGILIENHWWKAAFSRQAAALVALAGQPSGRDLLRGPARLFAMQDTGHAWGGESRYVYNEPFSPFEALTPRDVGDFAGMEGREGPALRITARGAAWVTVECLTGWQHTRAAVQYTFYADLPYLDVAVRLYMQARRKMIKWQLPFDLPQCRAVVEIPYGVTARPADASEYPYTRWLRLESSGLAVGVANNGQYGLDVSPDGLLNLSLSRGGVHCSFVEDDTPTDKSYTFMDQEQVDTRFRLLANTDASQLAADLVRAAAELNLPLGRFFAYYPPLASADAPSQAAPFLHVEPPTVALGALKKAEDGEALLVRLVETVGQAVTARVMLEGGPAQDIAFRPYEIKTFSVTRDSVTRDGVWTPVNLLEEPAR